MPGCNLWSEQGMDGGKRGIVCGVGSVAWTMQRLCARIVCGVGSEVGVRAGRVRLPGPLPSSVKKHWGFY